MPRPSGSAIPATSRPAHTATSAVCFGVVIYLLMCARDPIAKAEPASRVGLVGGLLVGSIAAWRSVLGDFHWIADGFGGLLLAFVVLVVAFAACRTYFDRRLGSSPTEAHDRARERLDLAARQRPITCTGVSCIK